MASTNLLPTVAISDGCLAAVSAGVALKMMMDGSHPMGIRCGLLIIAVAASFGTWRFGIDARIIHIHKALACVATGVGVPFLMLSLACRVGSHTSWQENVDSLLTGKPLILFTSSVALLFVLALNYLSFVETACSPALVVSVVLALAASVANRHVLGFIVIGLYILSGVFGADGVSFGVRNVNWLHYVLCIANLVVVYV